MSTPNIVTEVLPQVLDGTSIAVWRSCRQKFRLMHCIGYRPKGVSIDLHAGGCFASATQEVRNQVYGHKKPVGDALLIAQAKFFTEWGDIEPPPNNPMKKAKNKDNVWHAIEQYFTEQWTPLTDHVQPMYSANGMPRTEFTFSLPLLDITDTREAGGFPLHPSGSPFIYAGKFDLLGEYCRRPVPVDEKTTRGIGAGWADQWNLRSQFIGYIWALREMGIDAQEAVIRGISFQIQGNKFIEDIKPYSNFIVGRWYEQLRRDLWDMIRAHSEGYFDFDFGEACTAYGNCAFLQVCGSPNSDSWLTEFEIKHWNPLLHTASPDTVPMLTR